MSNYLEINRRLWNERARAHLTSDFYDVKSFLEGASSLNDIELDLLGLLSGKTILHLQCHFGQDSLSLARLGAEVTGIDFSDEAIKNALMLTQRTGLDATFICCDLYDLPHHLDKQFDIVFTSYGVIGWLPDLDKWADIVTRYLAPGGKFVMVEFHPVIWMFDNAIENIRYSYFKDEAVIEIEQGSYGAKDTEINLEAVTWNHAIAEVLQPLLRCGLELREFKELDYSPYNIFPGMTEISKGKFRIEKYKGLLPLVYAVVMQQQEVGKKFSGWNAF